jgi:mannose-6-phosphate isomerase-like protein (cupin superfamily)
MADWKLVDEPVRIPAPGGKLIEELFGRASTQTERFSLAHMVAPPQWGEPAQTPEFGELTVMVRGRMHIEVGDDGDTVELMAGQAFWVEPGVRVRYSNPYDEQSEYFAICIPAFSVDAVHREEG